MPTSARLLKFARLAHLYLGVFAAPALLFFAFTGAVQTFSLHETTRGSSYKPPRVLVLLAQIHKKQNPVLAAPKPQAVPKAQATPAAASPDKPASSPAAPVSPAPVEPKPPATPVPSSQPRYNPLPLKIFFLLISVSLLLSTLTGVYMSYKYVRNKVAVTAVLVLGAAIPIVMIVV